VNGGGAPVGVRNGGRDVNLPAGGPVPVAAVGTVNIQVMTYNFATLSGEGHTSVHPHSGDDISLRRVPGSRFKVIIGPGLGLSLTRPIPGPPAHHAPIRARDL
jgi:hypothetical protein